MLVREKVNEVARLLYRRMGYLKCPGFDFEKSTHPQERMCFDMACIAWQQITGDTPDLEAEFNE